MQGNVGLMNTVYFVCFQTLFGEFKSLNGSRCCVCGRLQHSWAQLCDTKFPSLINLHSCRLGRIQGSEYGEAVRVWESENCPPYLKELR